MFRFLGILFGVAIRTKKPLDLHLAPFVWKLLAGMQIYLFVCFYKQNNFIFTLKTQYFLFILTFQITGIPATVADIEECDNLFVQTLKALKDIHNAGVDASNFNEVRLYYI